MTDERLNFRSVSNVTLEEFGFSAALSYDFVGGFLGFPSRMGERFGTEIRAYNISTFLSEEERCSAADAYSRETLKQCLIWGFGFWQKLTT
jgi:hypothetical protein